MPGDMFAAIQNNSATSCLSENNEFTKLSADWQSWWPDDGLQAWLDESGNLIDGVLPRSIWPLRIRGQMIGTCCGLIDLTIDSGRNCSKSDVNVVLTLRLQVQP